MSAVTFGSYEIRRELGRGAMGVVYEAHDPARGLDVALKIMSPRPAATPEARRRQVERFYTEARALAGLRHPHIVRIFDRGEAHGRHYFSMELLHGTTLRDRLRYQGPLSVPDLRRLAVELCDALAHMHDRGVIHRDIKPDNIMLVPAGGSKLMDFGVARILAEEDPGQGGGFHGSPAYMSPEQVAGQPVDGRSDLYSLALTLYEAATGRRAVTGDTIPEIAHKVATEYPPPPAGLPFYLQGVLFRALSKDPAHRYARAPEMAEDIRAARLPAALAGAVPRPPGTAPAPAGSPPSPPSPALYPPLPGLASAPGDPTLLPDSPSLFEFELPSLPEKSPRSACRLHPTLPGVAACSRCSHPMCYTCYLEIPGQGIICRACAFGPGR